MASAWHQSDYRPSKKNKTAPAILGSLPPRPVYTNRKRELPTWFVGELKKYRLQGYSKECAISLAGARSDLTRRWRKTSPELDAELKLFEDQRPKGFDRYVTQKST